MIIAIDGPAASGKGTLGKKLAQHYGLRHLDTGLLYRAVGKMLLSALSPDALAARYPRDRELTGMTSRSITSPVRLRARLEEIRHRGLSYRDSTFAMRCARRLRFGRANSCTASELDAEPVTCGLAR